MACVSTVEELRAKLTQDRPHFLELWVENNEQSMCALINGNLGWLMYLRKNGDAGFSSRASNYKGPPDALIEYNLENGQTDEYPASWALPAGEIQRALEYFMINGQPTPWIIWHNDSGDGVTIGKIS